jgi:hypothetical protein
MTRYAHMKKDVFHEGRQGKVLSLGELLLAAGTAGIPAGESLPFSTQVDQYSIHHMDSLTFIEFSFNHLDSLSPIISAVPPRALSLIIQRTLAHHLTSSRFVLNCYRFLLPS